MKSEIVAKKSFHHNLYIPDGVTYII